MEEVDVKKIIVQELKDAGLDIAEEMAVVAVKGLFAALPKVVAATENKVDDLIVPVLMVIQPKIMELLDKIDGKEDERK